MLVEFLVTAHQQINLRVIQAWVVICVQLPIMVSQESRSEKAEKNTSWPGLEPSHLADRLVISLLKFFTGCFNVAMDSNGIHTIM